ncbi:helix-turn-helix transcriptional regulator [Brevundimonas denitrificans]|uniref:helix-turn-helix transcriptional regulator n=1 Tax=Brevundimonas denitrificans TaxID=1443434 RepID=UPI00223BA5A8|nr:helix-turn-helix domain-containing protein [Brevundimonas denitrificans]
MAESELGNRLKALRSDAGLTQAELAALVGVPENHQHRRERGLHALHHPGAEAGPRAQRPGRNPVLSQGMSPRYA